MQKLKLTASFVKKLTPGTPARYADTEVPNLQVRVLASSISFYLRKRHGKTMHEICLGKYPDMTLEEARTAALDKLGAIANYQDIHAGSGRKSPLLREAFDFYLTTQSNQACVKSTLNHFAPLADRKICDISPEDVRQIFDSMKNTPYAANNAVKYLSAAVNKLARNLRMTLPDLTVSIQYHKTTPRTRVMREDEAPKIISRLKTLVNSPMYRDQAEAILLMIYTGQRKSRVLGITGEQIDPEYRIWNVPGNPIKRPLELALNDYAWGIISRRMSEHPDGPLFLWRGKPMKDVRKTFSTVCSELGISGLHIHDLRRTLGTWMLSSGATIEEVSKTLGHSSIRVTEQVYAHLLQSAGRAATMTAIDAMNRGATESAGNDEKRR